MTLPRSPQNGQPRPLRLTPRDRQILATLGDYRFLSIPQATALFFESASTAASRLRALHHAGLAVQVFEPVRPNDKSHNTLYALSARGARVVAEDQEGLRPRHLSDREHHSGLFLSHTLRRNDVRVILERLDRDPTGPDLLLWRQAPEDVKLAVQIATSKGTLRIPAVADGYFVLRHQGEVQGFLLEVDMGTVRRTTMALRYRAYWQLWREGLLRARFGHLPLRVLTLTVTPARRAALCRLAAQVPPGRSGSGLFWFGLLADADLTQPHHFLTSVFEVATAKPSPPRPLFSS